MRSCNNFAFITIIFLTRAILLLCILIYTYFTWRYTSPVTSHKTISVHHISWLLSWLRILVIEQCLLSELILFLYTWIDRGALTAISSPLTSPYLHLWQPIQWWSFLVRLSFFIQKVDLIFHLLFSVLLFIQNHLLYGPSPVRFLYFYDIWWSDCNYFLKYFLFKNKSK